MMAVIKAETWCNKWRLTLKTWGLKDGTCIFSFVARIHNMMPKLNLIRCISLFSHTPFCVHCAHCKGYCKSEQAVFLEFKSCVSRLWYLKLMSKELYRNKFGIGLDSLDQLKQQNFSQKRLVLEWVLVRQNIFLYAVRIESPINFRFNCSPHPHIIPYLQIWFALAEPVTAPGEN